MPARSTGGVSRPTRVSDRALKPTVIDFSCTPSRVLASVALLATAALAIWGGTGAMAGDDGASPAAPGQALAGTNGDIGGNGNAPLRVNEGIGIFAAPHGQIIVRQRAYHALPVAPGGNGQAAADAAQAWIADEPAMFGGVAAADLRLKRLHPLPLVGNEPGTWWAIEFEQVVDGRPIEDAVMQVHVMDTVARETCEAVLILGRTFPAVKAVQQAELSRDEVLALVARDANLSVADLAKQVTDEYATARVFKNVATPMRHIVLGEAGWDFVVNEISGEITPESTLHYDSVTVQATVDLINEDPATRTPGTPLRDVEIDYGTGTAYTDVNGQVTTPATGASMNIRPWGLHARVVQWNGTTSGTVPIQSQTVVGSGSANFNNTSEHPQAENDLYYHTTEVWYYLSTRIDTAVSGSPFDTYAMEAQASYGQSGNANYSGSGGTISGGPRIRHFEANGTYRNTAMSDVIYHEFGHYADDRMGGITSAGGLSEGWGDVIASYLSGDPELGEGFNQSDDPATGTGIRSAANTYSWDGSDEIHLAGTALSGFAWDLREAFIAAGIAGTWTNPTPPIQRAEEIVFAALDANTSSVPDTITFVDTYDSLNGGDSITQAAISAAAANHGLDPYLAQDYDVQSVTCDTGFVWAGTAATATISITVRNIGGPASAIDATITGTPTAIPPQSTPVLTPGQSHTLDFQWNLATEPAGIYTVTAAASTTSSGPIGGGNVLIAIGPQGGNSVFSDDFESGTSQWTLDAPFGTQTAHAHSPTRSLADSPSGDYGNGANITAESVPFSTVGTTGTAVSLWFRASMELDFDYANIEIAAAGQPWQVLQRITGDHLLRHEAFLASAYDGLPSVRVRVRIWTDGGATQDGINIDDILVYGANTPGSTAPPTDTLAYDGFESTDFAGGTGWSGAWTDQGNVNNATNGPFLGNRHGRFRGGNTASRGRLERAANLSGETDVRVSMAVWASSLEPGDTFNIEFSDDGGSNWTTLVFDGAWQDAQFVYRWVDVALSELGLTPNSQFRIRLHAAGFTSTQDFFYVDEVRVYRANHAPVLAPIGTLTGDEGIPFGPYTITATDADPGQTLTFSATNLPAWATLTNLGGGQAQVTGNPPVGSTGITNTTFTVSDNGSGPQTDSEVVQIVIGQVNLPPVLTVPGPQSTDEGQLLSFVVSATDPDLDPITLGATNLPTGASFVAATGTFSWTPDFTAAAGSPYTVTFSADDGINPPTTDDVVITVIDVNRPPVFTPISPINVNPNDPVNFTALATDPDLDTLTHAMTQSPTGATYDTVSGDFAWTPDDTHMGQQFIIIIEADDGFNPAVQLLIEINVVDPSSGGGGGDGGGGCCGVAVSTAGREVRKSNFALILLALGALAIVVATRRRGLGMA